MGEWYGGFDDSDRENYGSYLAGYDGVIERRHVSVSGGHFTDEQMYGKGGREITSVSSKYKPREGFIIVKDSDPHEFSRIPNLTDSEEAILMDHFDGHKDPETGTVYGFVDKSRAGYVLGDKQVATCAFQASDQYMKHHLGMCLDQTDEKWYKSHPLTVGAGLPQHYTITVLNDLIKPYGIGVSKVYVKRGNGPSEEMKKWWDTLGVNPEARISQLVSNSEFFDNMSEGNEETKKMLQESLGSMNFDYVDELPAGCIICEGKNGGGHASYKAPRGVAHSWTIAIQYDRLENCVYHNEPPSFPYEPMYTLSYKSCKNVQGKTFSDLLSEKWKTSFPTGQGSSYKSSYSTPSKEISVDQALRNLEKDHISQGTLATSYPARIEKGEIVTYKGSTMRQVLLAARGNKPNLYNLVQSLNKGIKSQITWDASGFDNFLLLYADNNTTIEDIELTINSIGLANRINGHLLNSKGEKFFHKYKEEIAAGLNDSIPWDQNNYTQSLFKIILDTVDKIHTATFADMFALFTFLDVKIIEIFNVIYDLLDPKTILK